MNEAGTITVTAKVASGTKDVLKEFRPLFRAERKPARRLAGEPECNPPARPGKKLRSSGRSAGCSRGICGSGANWWTPWMSW